MRAPYARPGLRTGSRPVISLKVASSAASASRSDAGRSGGDGVPRGLEPLERGEPPRPRCRRPSGPRARRAGHARRAGPVGMRRSGSRVSARACTAHASRWTVRSRTSAPERTPRGGPASLDPPPRERPEEADRVVLRAVPLPVAGDDLLALTRPAGLGRAHPPPPSGRRSRAPRGSARSPPPGRAGRARPRAASRPRPRGRRPRGRRPGTRRCAPRSPATGPSRPPTARDRSSGSDRPAARRCAQLRPGAPRAPRSGAIRRGVSSPVGACDTDPPLRGAKCLVTECDPRHALPTARFGTPSWGSGPRRPSHRGLDRRQTDEVQVFNLAATRPDLNHRVRRRVLRRPEGRHQLRRDPLSTRPRRRTLPSPSPCSQSVRGNGLAGAEAAGPLSALCRLGSSAWKEPSPVCRRSFEPLPRRQPPLDWPSMRNLGAFAQIGA